MIKVIMGLKGSGKTKKLIDLIHKATTEEHGDVVCIEKNDVLTFDIPHSVRLVKLSQYKVSGYTALKGFLCGLQAGNYDITHIFMDGLYKLADTDSLNEAEEFLDWLDAFSEREGVKFTLTLSADESLATAGIKKYL
jgi:hypothetical protein